MSSYLIQTGALPFTGAELCTELGIDPAQFASAIEDIITVEACNSAKPVLASVWRVSEGPRFEQESLHGGAKPLKVGEPVDYMGGTFRDCTYVAHPHTVAVLRVAVLAKARNTEDRLLGQAIIDAEARRKVEAHDTLKVQLVGSLEMEAV